MVHPGLRFINIRRSHPIVPYPFGAINQRYPRRRSVSLLSPGALFNDCKIGYLLTLHCMWSSGFSGLNLYLQIMQLRRTVGDHCLSRTLQSHSSRRQWGVSTRAPVHEITATTIWRPHSVRPLYMLWTLEINSKGSSNFMEKGSWKFCVSQWGFLSETAFHLGIEFFSNAYNSYIIKLSVIWVYSSLSRGCKLIIWGISILRGIGYLLEGLVKFWRIHFEGLEPGFYFEG